MGCQGAERGAGSIFGRHCWSRMEILMAWRWEVLWDRARVRRRIDQASLGPGGGGIFYRMVVL